MPLQPIQGDPTALRAGADRIRQSQRAIDTGVRDVQDSQRIAASGWLGQAASAFQNAAASTSGRVAALARLTGAAAILDTYADTLERCQREWNDAYAIYEPLGIDLSAPHPDLPAAQQAFLRMTQAQDTALRANEGAANVINQLMAGVDDGAADEQARVKANDVGLAGIANFGERITGPWSPGLHLAGVLGGPFAAISSQSLKDSDNPNYSVGERVGRSIGAGLSQGLSGLIGGIGGAAAGGAIGSALAPGPGTIVGAAAGAWGAGYGAGEIADALDDEAVDIVGDLGDGIGDGIVGLGSFGPDHE